jgi:hypothetical protein
MVSNLPPLNFKEEVEKYDAFEEKKTVEFLKCPHKHTVIANGRLKCKCGNAWSGNIADLIELQKLLIRRTP